MAPTIHSSLPWPTPQFLQPKCGASLDYHKFLSFYINLIHISHCKNKTKQKNKMSLFAFEIEVGRGGGANKAKIFIGSKGIDMISEWDQSLFVYCSPTSLIYR